MSVRLYTPLDIRDTCVITSGERVNAYWTIDSARVRFPACGFPIKNTVAAVPSYP